jgi:hypothetical protein
MEVKEKNSPKKSIKNEKENTIKTLKKSRSLNELFIHDTTGLIFVY